MGRPKLYATPGERTAAWKRLHPERNRELNRAATKRWRVRNPERALAGREAQRAGYGLSVEDLQALEVKQDGRCAICGRKPESRLNVDHDHTRGGVRGLLCAPCNLAIGLFRDDPDRLRSAADYLERPRP